MNIYRVALALSCLWLVVDSTFVLTGTVGVGVAVAAAGLAGVAGLAKGAALVGILAGGRGGGGRSHYHQRWRRDIEIQQETDMVLDMVAAADVYGCALKLVCLVESKPADQLSAEDELILQLFGNKPAPVAESEVRSARTAYFYAAYLGDSQGKDACQQIFHQCDASYDLMMNYVRAIKA